MNILMMTNTYTPLVGGLERSVRDFTVEFRRRGHRVVVVAPVYKGMPPREPDVVRVPAIQNFTGSDFSLKLPMPRAVGRLLKAFQPDLVHAHHPFLMGGTALRVAQERRIPLVFTHHTLFEQYTHYLPVQTPQAERFMIALSTGYANLCTRVFAPSESVAELIQERGVTTPIDVVPTGITLRRFTHGTGASIRAAYGIPRHALVIGCVGRLSPEKNPLFWAEALIAFLGREPRAHCLLVGRGPSEEAIRARFAEVGLADRLHCPGVLQGQRLIEAYHAMGVFAFTSTSETQGIVLLEAMACGVPVVGLDAPGVREVVRDRVNGRLVAQEHVAEFVTALRWMARLSAERRRAVQAAARATAAEFSIERCATRALECYTAVLLADFVAHPVKARRWAAALGRLRAEWGIVRNVAHATGAAFSEPALHSEALP